MLKLSWVKITALAIGISLSGSVASQAAPPVGPAAGGIPNAPPVSAAKPPVGAAAAGAAGAARVNAPGVRAPAGGMGSFHKGMVSVKTAPAVNAQAVATGRVPINQVPVKSPLASTNGFVNGAKGGLMNGGNAGVSNGALINGGLTKGGVPAGGITNSARLNGVNSGLNGGVNGLNGGFANSGLNGSLNGLNGSINGSLTNGGLSGNLNGGVNGLNGGINGGINGGLNSGLNGGLNGSNGGLANGGVTGSLNGLNCSINGGLTAGGLNGSVNGGVDGLNGGVNGRINGVNGLSNGGLTGSQNAVQQMAGTRLNPANAASGIPATSGLVKASLNQNGLMALSGNNGLSTMLQQRLNLSSSQISEINQFQANYNQEIAQLRNRMQSDPQGTASLMNQAGQQLQQRIDSVMTPQQRQTFSQLTGVPDSFSGTSSLNNVPSTATGSPIGPNGINSNVGLNTATSVAAPPAIPASSFATGKLGASALVGLPATQPLRLGSGGFLPISNPAVQQALQLTPSQLSQLQAMQGSYVQQLGELSGRFQTDPQGTLSLYNNALQQSNQQIESVLTPQQRQLLSSMTGMPNAFSGGNTIQTPTTQQ